MATNFLRLTQLTVYMVIASQLVFYAFILSDALKQVSIQNFLELRKVIDLSFGYRFKVMYYSGLALSLTVVLVNAKEPQSAKFITSVIAFLCLIADVLIATKGNVPINMLFNNFSHGDTSQNWNTLRATWLRLINIRAAFIITGMITQLIGLIWAKYN